MSIQPLHPVARFLCVVMSYIDRFVIRSFFFSGRCESGRRLPGEAPSLKQTAVSPLHASHHFMSSFYNLVASAGKGGRKKSIAGINVAWAHRRVGYYTCKKLLEAALVSSLVLCTWWSWYDRRGRQLCYTACNEYLSSRLSLCICVIYIKISIIECQGLIHCDSVDVKEENNSFVVSCHNSNGAQVDIRIRFCVVKC